MRKDDLIRIRHMLDAATEAMSFIKDKNRSDLDRDGSALEKIFQKEENPPL